MLELVGAGVGVGGIPVYCGGCCTVLVGVRAGVLVVGSDAVRSPVGSAVLALLVVLGPVEEVHSKLTV